MRVSYAIKYNKNRHYRMKKTIILSLLILIRFSLFAQYDGPTAPDYGEIEKNIRISGSHFYYPTLMQRYLDADATMTLEEMRHLYYGYIYQPDYAPTDTSQYNALLAEVLSKQSFTAADYGEIVKYADELLKEDPFNMRALNAKLLVYAQQNNVEDYKKAAQRRSVVQKAIASSGDGMGKQTAYYVIKVAHEYDILGFLGFKYGGTEQVEKRCDCNSLTLSQNRFGVDKIYFNIKPVLDYIQEKGGKM